jgi:hypothetical protein
MRGGMGVRLGWVCALSSGQHCWPTIFPLESKHMDDNQPLVTYIPEHTDATDSHKLPAFEFILSNADWRLLLKLAQEKGGVIADFFAMIDDAVTSDEHAREIDWPEDCDIDSAPYYRCRIAVEHFVSTGIRPGDFNDYIGETKLIPIVYEMTHWPLPEQD